MSLTSILNKIPNKLNCFKGTLPQSFFSSYPTEINNPYPKWVDDRKLWGVFGTFTDYIIRKMIQGKFPQKVVNNNILAKEVCESKGGPSDAEFLAICLDEDDFVNSYTILKEMDAEKLKKVTDLANCCLLYLKDLDRLNVKYRVSREFVMGKSGDQDKEKMDFFNTCKNCVQNYEDPKMGWANILADAWQMSYADNYYRSGIFRLPASITQRQLGETVLFFSKVEKLIMDEFKTKSVIYLNPVIGSDDTVSADADIIADDCLYDIKTVKDPSKYVRNEYYQLLGYVTLLNYQKESKKFIVGFLKEIELIGQIAFIFPLQQVIIKMEVKDWSSNSKQGFLQKILQKKKNL